MTKQEIISILQKDIACEKEPYCKTDCEECEHYVERTKMVEAHKELLRLLIKEGL